MIRFAPALLLMLAPIACAAPRQPAQSAPAAIEGPLGEVAPQSLQPGQCGLALWTRAPSAQRIFWAYASPPIARMVIDGRALDLRRTEEVGEPLFGFPPQARYVAGGVSVAVDVDFESRSDLMGGAVVRAGTISYVNPAGAELMVPVAGLLACQ
jgi:hypothetical protein